MGSKGRNTRRRLIDVTAGLLEVQGLHDIRVADIARLANTSPATFYLYFCDVVEAALAAINEHSQSTPSLLKMIAQPWSGDGLRDAEALVAEYVAVWSSQAAIFRARNLAAEAGEPGFYAARERAVLPLFQALADRVARRQAAGCVPAAPNPRAMAGVVLMLLERLSAIASPADRESGVTYDTMAAAAAYVLVSVLQGEQEDSRGPPSGARLPPGV